MKIILQAIAIALLSSTAALAEPTPARVAPACAPGASLALSGGEALVSRGGSFREIRDGAALSAGDRILVRAGVASVRSGAQTLIAAKAGGMLTIESGKQGAICVSRVSADPTLVGEAPRGGGLPNDQFPGGDLFGGLNPWVVGGVLGAGVAGGAAAAASSHGGDRTHDYLVLLGLQNQSHQ